ncbi:MAG: pyruvate formate lyase family protein [Candidatus Brocadiia bacterium]
MSVTEHTRRIRTPSEETLKLCERARRFEDDSDPFHRGLVATRVYRDQPELPVVMKRAEVLARTLETLEPTVLPEERIVGAAYRRFRVHPGVSDPDAWRIRVLHPERWGYREDWPLPDEVREEMRWWAGEDAPDPPRNEARERNRPLMRYGLAHPHGWVQGHTLPDHGIILEHGIGRLRERIARRREDDDLTPARKVQLRAMDRCLEGLFRHVILCASRAEERAEQVQEPQLAERLARVAEDCRKLASKAPETFAQALQMAYFSNFADHMNTAGDAASYGRLDQLLHPFYESDRRSGVLSEEEAFELICHFLIKNWCLQDSQNITLGGVTLDGEDATNELSYMFLEAMEASRMVTDISVRLHDGSPPEFVRTVARVTRHGFGRPSIYNDEVAVPALSGKGIEPEDARDYAPLGCVELMIPGRSAFRTMCMGLNLPKVLELTLNRGRCLVTGDVVWDDVPEHFPTFEDLLAEYRRRVQGVVERGIRIIREDERIEPTVWPRPYLTVLSRGGIEDAVDLTAGQPKYDPVGVTLKGLADIANSLCAVRRLVYKDGKLTLDEFRDVLRADWGGHESLRQRVLNEFPRFGCDQAETNALAREEGAHYADCFEGAETYHGGPFLPMIFGVGTTLMASTNAKTGATPSGRRAGEALSMSLQPSPAGPRGGPTELLRSVAAVDFGDFAGGVSNVQELDPAPFKGEAGLDRLTELIRSFFGMGGLELSLNFLSEEQLRDARRHPECYQHLMVRLFGLSARFVHLSPELQESIIERAVAGRCAT